MQFLYNCFFCRVPSLHVQKKLAILLLTVFTTPHASFAQANAIVPNSYFNPVSYDAFQVPTSTDVAWTADKPLQAIVSTSPAPELYWDDNAGHTGQLHLSSAVTNFNEASIVLLDDIALASNGETVLAYISCRVSNIERGTDLYLIVCKWNAETASFIFLQTIFIYNRIDNDDQFDRMSIDVNKHYHPDDPIQFVLVFTVDGAIYYNQSKVDYSSGNLHFDYDDPPGKLIFKGSEEYPGSFRCPDISNQSTGHGVICALFKDYHSGRNKVLVKTSDVFYDYTPIEVYSDDENDEYTLRTPRLEVFNKYDFVLAFNRLSHHDQRSDVMLSVKYSDQKDPVYAFPINSPFEESCDRVSTWMYTGFPDIRVTEKSDSYYHISFDVVWQQVLCKEKEHCNIQVLSRRYLLENTNALTPRNEEIIFYHVNSALSRNSVFPSIGALPKYDCRTFYSFGIMDKYSSRNGQVAYKNGNCNTVLIRPMPANVFAPAEQVSDNSIQVYPNPARDVLHIKFGTDILAENIILYTASGKQAESIMVKSRLSADMQVAKFAPGVYYIKVTCKNGNRVIKKIAIVK